jgi:hypothetical protein
VGSALGYTAPEVMGESERERGGKRFRLAPRVSTADGSGEHGSAGLV